MRSDLDVKLTSGLAVSLFIVLAVIRGPEFSQSILSIASNAVSGAVVLRFLYVKWLWKWKILRFLECIHQMPYLEGKWEGEYHSTGNDKTPADRLKGAAAVEICQPNIHTIKIIRRSNESESRSFSEEMQVGEDGIPYLTYSYLSVPKATVRDRSAISYGTARLALHRDHPERLEGNYWSDQKTTGTLSLEKAT